MKGNACVIWFRIMTHFVVQRPLLSCYQSTLNCVSASVKGIPMSLGSLLTNPLRKKPPSTLHVLEVLLAKSFD